LKRGLAEKTKRLVAGAEHLHSTADIVHKKADQLHKMIHAVNQGESIRQKQHPAGPETDIVTDDGHRGKPKSFSIVGIGASAGGYEAFADMLTQLPSDTGMGFVLVQHLDPKHKSQLTQLLGHSSKLPVIQANDDLEVSPNRIYVIPENANM